MYRGWWMACGGCVCMGMVAVMAVSAYGLYLEPLKREFGWSQTAISTAFGVTFIIAALASPLVGRLVDHHGPRRVMAAGTVVTACLYLGLSQVTAFWHLFLILGFLAFFQVWIFYIPLTCYVTRWFRRRRATAMAIVTSGFGFGGLMFLPLMAGTIDVIGWRDSLVAAGGITVLVNGTFLLLFRDTPDSRCVQPEESSPAADQSEDGLLVLATPREMFRRAAFWLLVGGFSFFFFAQWAFLFHAIPFFESRGLASGDAALVLSAAAGLGVFLRLCAGLAIDRLRYHEPLAAAALFTMACATVLLMVSNTWLALGLFVVLWGVGSGIAPLLQPLVISRVFGMRHYGTVYGTSDGLDTMGVICGTWLGVLLLNVTGSYETILALYACAFLFGGISLVGLSRVSHSSERHSLAFAATQSASP